jgi:drug/metabolite transporter (DMT)-like permease
MQSFSGYFLGPVALFLSLARLSVVEHTLLFSLTLPCTALAAHLVLREALPRLFAMCAGLIVLGLVISVTGANHGGFAGFIDLIGVIWALVGVLAYSVSAVLNRMIALRRWGVGLCVGVSSMAAAVVFAVIALSLYGPSHFLYLRMWWVLGVIGGYALTITLGSQWSLMLAYAKLGVVPVTFWSSLTIVVAIAAAHALLGEPLFVNTIVGACLIIVAIGIYQKLCQGGTGNRPESTHLA